jgi:electron transport complex protein RnfB
MAGSLQSEVALIDALLPQTQCTRCGYTGCTPYAAAIASGEAQINQCPPGGSATNRALSALLGREFLPLNPINGVETAPRVAWIDEARCIGCARCLPPCPVDAILGAQRQLHTVIESWCTGCELCLPACPVDCMHLRPAISAPPTPEQNRQRYLAQSLRREQSARERSAELAALGDSTLPDAQEPQ